MTDFIKVRDVSADAFNHIIDEGIAMKHDPEPFADALKGRTLAMLFQKTSTRTRFSFEVGMTQLGGHAIFAETRHTQMGIADIKDEGLVIGRYADLIMARFREYEDLAALAEGSEVPVINGCDNRYHPAQALTDLMTIKEHFGTTEGLKIVYLGIANNVSNSLSMASIYCDAHFTLCVPEFDPDAVDEEQLELLRDHPNYEETASVAKAVKDADVLYTDTWINMEYFTDPEFVEEKQRRIDQFMPYQVNEDLLAKTGNDDTVLMHCLPAHKGYEVNHSVIYHENSIVFEQAENRLHAQKALMLYLLDRI